MDFGEYFSLETGKRHIKIIFLQWSWTSTFRKERQTTKKRTDFKFCYRVVRKLTDLTDIPDMIYNM